MSTFVVAAVTTLWGVLRLWSFSEQQFPLTFVLPLLLCVWTRRPWQLGGMVVVFFGMATVKYFWLLPEPTRTLTHGLNTYLVTLVNIALGGLVVRAILRLRDRLDERAETMQRQNGELEAQSEELAQQNEEIKTQSEELAQQNEEIESQAEELERQNEELLESNQRLTAREEILQTMVNGTREAGDASAALELVCGRVLGILGAPAEAIAVAELDREQLILRAQVTAEGVPRFPATWPRAGSVADLVLSQKRTAYIDDLSCRPDLSLPFGPRGHYRSVLATPLALGGRVHGALLVCNRAPSHWTQDQFRLVEWAAPQCGWLIESDRWQRELRERATELETANRAKDNFLATLSHELRTPLSPVLAAAEEMADDARLPQDVRDDLQMIRRNVAVQSRLIDDLLDLTRITRGKLDLNQQPVRVETLLRDSAAIVASELAANEQTIQLDLNLPDDCLVVGDAARLQQVFWNLLKNSAKFSPRGAVIEMHAAVRAGGAAGDGRTKREVVIEVVDHGTGIAPHDMGRIFRPFEQVAAVRRDGGVGLGLGLSIAQAITELHDGRIHAQSDGLGRGAKFVVQLPLASLTSKASNPLTPSATAAAAAAPRPESPFRILLVEDHADTREAMARILRRQGYLVERAGTVTEALARWPQGGFHLLISDLGLPDGSGLELMRQVRSATRETVRGICMSGYGMEIDLSQSREAGYLIHLIKPVSKQQLLEALARALPPVDRTETS